MFVLVNILQWKIGLNVSYYPKSLLLLLGVDSSNMSIFLQIDNYYWNPVSFLVFEFYDTLDAVLYFLRYNSYFYRYFIYFLSSSISAYFPKCWSYPPMSLTNVFYKYLCKSSCFKLWIMSLFYLGERTCLYLNGLFFSYLLTIDFDFSSIN
jgi:hypothetical protein